MRKRNAQIIREEHGAIKGHTHVTLISQGSCFIVYDIHLVW